MNDQIKSAPSIKESEESGDQPQAIDPHAARQPALENQERIYKEQLRRNEEIRNNINMIKSPLEKFQQIPPCRLQVGVCASFLQQLSLMCVKISYVLVPRSDANSYRLRNWDLWGPFFFLVLFAFFINNSDQLLLIIVSMFLGAYMVTYNVIALGGKVSFFQSFAILNYCIFPIFMGVFIQKILFLFQIKNRIFQFSIMGAAVIWSCFSVYVFIGVNVSENKKFIAVYPALLYYLYIGILLAFM